MRNRNLLPLLAFPLLVCSLTAAARAAQSAQASAMPAPHGPNATEANQIALMDKAKHGDADAQMWLGTAYEQGSLGKKDYQAALVWSRKSAAQGNPDAQFDLGRMYEDGEGVKQNYKQAAKWYRKAAEHVPDYGGAGQGRNNLGLLYMEGRGVPRNYVQACMWFLLANARENASDAKAQMTPAEIVEAERMAGEWRNSHPQSLLPSTENFSPRTRPAT